MWIGSSVDRSDAVLCVPKYGNDLDMVSFKADASRLMLPNTPQEVKIKVYSLNGADAVMWYSSVT
jgi:hypothetical protein